MLVGIGMFDHKGGTAVISCRRMTVAAMGSAGVSAESGRGEESLAVQFRGNVSD
jgi:hypothetical protein